MRLKLAWTSCRLSESQFPPLSLLWRAQVRIRWSHRGRAHAMVPGIEQQWESSSSFIKGLLLQSRSHTPLDGWCKSGRTNHCYYRDQRNRLKTGPSSSSPGAVITCSLAATGNTTFSLYSMALRQRTFGFNQCHPREKECAPHSLQ